MEKVVVLLINIGSPDKPESKSVRKYLSQFLNDKYVIDLPWIIRRLLMIFFIAPYRVPKTTKKYEKIWKKEGAPLLCHLNNLVTKIQNKFPSHYIVYGAMRYGNPSVGSIIDKIKDEKLCKIIVVPLYPHYAKSTTESVKHHVLDILKKNKIKAGVKFLDQFYDHPLFLESFAKKIASYHPDLYDHIVFSYHGLPIRHIETAHPHKKYSNCNCETRFPWEYGKFCYKAVCYQTSRDLAKKLSIPAGRYSVAFQSQISKKWITPFTDKVLTNLSQQGKKKILVVAPSFVADCLETTYEIGIEYQELLVHGGGDKLTLVESLNDSDDWVAALATIVSEL